MDNTVEQDQEHEVYGGDITEMDTYFEDPEDINKRLKEIEEEAGALREMQPKVLKKIGSAQDFMENQELKETDGEGEWKLNIPKLADAYFAATSLSEECTLILTQGSSAKTFAMCGLSVVGQDCYGVFPLKSSKLFNVRDASNEILQKSAEFQNIKKILGLKYNTIYENVKELRYGHLMIMADQDHNGSFFKGQLINFLHLFWPSLLKVPNFLLDFIPPIVVASTKETTVEKFHSMADYEAWKNRLGNKVAEYEIKYRKGLASNETEEVKEYFANLRNYTRNFFWADEEDGDAIEHFFDKTKIGARKYWLQPHQAGYLNIRYRDFIHKELVVFLNLTSIPSIVDGLNLGQRKILFCAFKKPILLAINVSKFSGYVSGHSAYPHDNARLVGTIISMAQNYVGKIKINLFQQEEQFGTCLMGGKDHSSASNILVHLSPVTRFIFHEADEHLLNFLNDNGQSVEPAWYIPIIPLVLVNGGEGIGAGWSTSIPKYNPLDIIFNLRQLLNDVAMVPMEPLFESDTTRVSTANMHLFDEDGVIQKYDTPEQILKKFVDIRLPFYEKRRTRQLCKLNKTIKLLNSKVRYIRLVLDRVIKVGYETLVELLNELKKHELEKETEVEEEVAAGEEKPQGNASKMVLATGYHYLLSMDILSFTEEKIVELEKKRDRKQNKYDALNIEKPNSLWKRDLDELSIFLMNETFGLQKEAPKKKAPAKQTAASPLPQRANKKRNRGE